MRSDAAHILLIDDDPDMHDVVRLILAPEGYRLTCCASSRTGLQVLREDPPQLLLLDIMLSTPTEGWAVAERVRADQALTAMPIVMVSSMPRESGFEQVDRWGNPSVRPEQFLEKPLDADELRATVAQLLAPA